MKYKHFLYIAPLIAFLFSCEKEIEFKGDEVKTKLVLNGILMPDSVVKIQLTESRFFLDNSRSFNKIDHAEVTLWKDGEQIEFLQHTSEGYYTGTYIPREGDNLRITASCPGFDPIECETQIVSATPIIAVDTANTRVEIREAIIGESDNNGNWIATDTIDYLESVEGDIAITFKDTAGIANYYAIRLYLHIRYESGDVYDWPLYYTSDDMVFKTNNELSFNDDDDYTSARSSHLFGDDLFDGREYRLKIKIYGYYGYYPYKESKITGTAILVTLQSLSPSYYLYLKTREASYDSEDFFTEPVQIYSNIKGGIGIFCNYSNSNYRIPLN